MRNIKYIAVHCTASSQHATIKELLLEFERKGWSKPGYHHIVDVHGKVFNTLSEDEVSNGVKGFNSNLINVAYIGGIDAKGNPVDNRTEEQKESLLLLLKALKEKYPNAIIQGHRDFSPDTNKNGIVDPWERIKACPCFDAKVEYKNL